MRGVNAAALNRALIWPLLFATLSAPGTAQEIYPTKSIRIIVPFAPGGIADLMARLLGKAIADNIGQTVVVENKPGGGTVIGTEAGVRARPDGHTVLMVSAPIATNPGLVSRLPYDALRDLVPVINVTSQGFLISVHEKEPHRSFVDLVEAARKPGADIAYASPGNGTLMHLVGQVMNAEYQTRFVHVPYKGSGPALQDAMGGQVPMIIDPVSTSLGPVRQGRLRPLAVTNATRMRVLPEVPTVRELGFPKAEAAAFSGFMLPAGTPHVIVARLNAEFNRALNLPEVRDKLVDQLGGSLTGGTPEEFGAMIKTETERWVPLIKRLGLKAD